MSYVSELNERDDADRFCCNGESGETQRDGLCQANKPISEARRSFSSFALSVYIEQVKFVGLH